MNTLPTHDLLNPDTKEGIFIIVFCAMIKQQEITNHPQLWDVEVTIIQKSILK